jgi:lysophospholipase L1-like esterase
MKKPIARFLSLLPLILAATPLHGEEPPRLTVFMVGDSTMADYPLKTPSPIRGWGQMLPQYLAPTHFNALGACRMADLAAAEIRAKVPGLAKWLRK